MTVKLPELIAEVQELDSDEKLEWLVEFSEQLPAVSDARAIVPFPDMCRVQECQTPVFLWVDVVAGQVHLEADVPRKSPTVRGLVALLVVGLEGATPQQVESIPDDLIDQLGLTAVLGMTRQRGFRGVVARVKQVVATRDGFEGEPS